MLPSLGEAPQIRQRRSPTERARRSFGQRRIGRQCLQWVGSRHLAESIGTRIVDANSKRAMSAFVFASTLWRWPLFAIESRYHQEGPILMVADRLCPGPTRALPKGTCRA